MANWRTQSSIIMEQIERNIDKGMTDKSKIFTKIVDELGVPRPTVRRCSRDLKTKLSKRVKILSDDSRLSLETKKKLLTMDF